MKPSALLVSNLILVFLWCSTPQVSSVTVYVLAQKLNSCRVYLDQKTSYFDVGFPSDMLHSADVLTHSSNTRNHHLKLTPLFHMWKGLWIWFTILDLVHVQIVPPNWHNKVVTSMHASAYSMIVTFQVTPPTRTCLLLYKLRAAVLRICIIS